MKFVQIQNPQTRPCFFPSLLVFNMPVKNGQRYFPSLLALEIVAVQQNSVDAVIERLFNNSKIEREMALLQVSYLGCLFVYRSSLNWRGMQREFARNDSKEGMYIFAVGESWSVCPPEGGATSTEFLARNEALPTFLVPRKEKSKKKKEEKGKREREKRS